jgi:hypothetical protein
MVVQGFQEMTRGDDVTGIPLSLFPGDSSGDTTLTLASYWSTLTSQDQTDVTPTTTRATHWIKMTPPVPDDVTRATSGLQEPSGRMTHNHALRCIKNG